MTAVPVSVSAEAVLEEIKALGITHVLTVPDSHQKTLLALLAKQVSPRLLTVCTEDEAIGINLGLYAGGQRPMLVIQNNGLYAGLNALKALALDARVPTLLMIGEFARDPAIPSRQNPLRAVRLLEPTLDTWSTPSCRLDSPEDMANLRLAYRQSVRDRGPVAVLVGAPMV